MTIGGRPGVGPCSMFSIWQLENNGRETPHLEFLNCQLGNGEKGASLSPGFQLAIGDKPLVTSFPFANWGFLTPAWLSCIIFSISTERGKLP